MIYVNCYVCLVALDEDASINKLLSLRCLWGTAVAFYFVLCCSNQPRHNVIYDQELLDFWALICSWGGFIETSNVTDFLWKERLTMSSIFLVTGYEVKKSIKNHASSWGLFRQLMVGASARNHWSLKVFLFRLGCKRFFLFFCTGN